VRQDRTIAFPNGSFFDLVRLEAGHTYQTRILQRLRNEHRLHVDHNLQNMEISPSIVHSNLVERHWRRALLSTQALLGMGAKTSAEDCITSQDHSLAQLDLEALLVELKSITEAYLETPIKHITVATPSFFTSADISDLKWALMGISLHPLPCGDIEESSIGATIATRFLEFPRDRDMTMTSSKCILGSFGLEEVITVEYTQDVFAFSVYKFFIGDKTWNYKREGNFIAVGNLSSNIPKSGFERDEMGFWSKIVTGIRRVALHRTVLHDRTLRLVLHGPSSLRPKVLSTIHAAIGTFLPNDSQPRAVRMILTPEEVYAKKIERGIISRTSMCVLFDQEEEWQVKDYEKDLLKIIHEAGNEWFEIKEGFLGSWGATLIGLQSRTMSCEERQAALERPWVWDNKRPSSFWYRDEHVLRE